MIVRNVVWLLKVFEIGFGEVNTECFDHIFEVVDADRPDYGDVKGPTTLATTDSPQSSDIRTTAPMSPGKPQLSPVQSSPATASTRLRQLRCEYLPQTLDLDQVMQSTLRFTRESSGALVFTRTAAIRDDLHLLVEYVTSRFKKDGISGGCAVSDASVARSLAQPVVKVDVRDPDRVRLLADTRAAPVSERTSHRITERRVLTVRA